MKINENTLKICKNFYPQKKKLFENSVNIDFSLPGYVFFYYETENSHGGISLLVPSKLKQT